MVENVSFLTRRNDQKFKIILLTIVFVSVFILSFYLGRYPIHPFDLMKVLFSNIFPVEQTWDSSVETVLYQIRLPRVIGAVLIGAALSTAGAVYQGLFQNPMCSPDLLGASSGAGFGAALAIMLHLGFFGITFLSFSFGVITVLLVYFISQKIKGNPILGLILTGIMISSIFSAAISFIKLVADPNDTLPAITYWLMGSLAGIGQKEVIFSIIPIFLGLIPLLFLRWRLNVMTMGDEDARTMGINTKTLRLIVILCATLVTSASVSISGMIGWVGLVIPHFARMITGPDYRTLIPSSMLLGASFMLIVDNFSRLATTQEIPLGILTAFIGAPFFMYLIIKEGSKQ